MAWLNPYIARIVTKPDVLLPCQSGITQTERELFLSKRAEFRELFCELGIGAGEHIAAQAKLRPDALFVGFELRFKRIFKAARKVEQEALRNVLLLRADARELPALAESGSINGVFVNFPDPWKKRRWTKHRLLSAEFVEKLLPLLTRGGRFYYKTDHQPSYEQLQGVLKSADGIRILEGLSPEQLTPTEFEKLFRSKGLPIYHILCEKY